MTPVKITPAQIEKVKSLLGALTQRQIALEVGVSKYVVFCVNKGKYDGVPLNKKAKSGMLNIHEYSNWLTGEKEFRRETKAA